jgi:protein-S-isoprenylcysteine O-methyltransferase Ste14
LAIASARIRLDVGKVIMVPAMALIFVAELPGLEHRGVSGAVGVLRSASSALALTYYALVIWCYLRRAPAIATSNSVTAHAAAVIGTWMLSVLPLLHGASPDLAREILADLLVVSGTAWAVWSVRYLGRNISVIAQARGVADQGPYRWVRHPLYLGEIVSALGLALAANSYAAIGLWFALCGLQAYRALREEQVLLQALPAYRGYRSRTAALLPGVF